MEETLKAECDSLRKEIHMLGERTRLLMKHQEVNLDPTSEKFGLMEVSQSLSEMRDNIVLAYRHLEDAGMRIGKVLQAQDGGTSIYDKLTP
jgi:hypothetical protein